MTGGLLTGPGYTVGGERRFLLTGVVSRYHREPSWDREELAEDLERMVALFAGELGYEHVPGDGPGPDVATDPGYATGFLHLTGAAA